MIQPFESKGIFSWQVPAVAKGEPEAFAAVLAEARFETVYLKVAEGPYVYKVRPSWLSASIENVSQELVNALRARNIAVIGWGFLYGVNAVGEAQIAASQVNRFGLDGYIFDIEKSFEDQPGRVNNARDIMAIFRARCAEFTPAAFCSWQLFKSWTGGAWHATDYAAAFMEKCDYGMPMVYWWGGNTPERASIHLNESIKQWRGLITDKPLITAGRAYVGDSGDATPESVMSFDAEVRAKGLKGISWWVLDQAINPKFHNGTIWEALSRTRPFGIQQPEPPAPVKKLIGTHKVNVYDDGSVEVVRI